MGVKPNISSPDIDTELGLVFGLGDDSATVDEFLRGIQDPGELPMSDVVRSSVDRVMSKRGVDDPETRAALENLGGLTLLATYCVNEDITKSRALATRRTRDRTRFYN